MTITEEELAELRCGANATSRDAIVCPFAPTHEVVFDVPAGHRYGYPDRPAQLHTLTCWLHLEQLRHTIEHALGVPATIVALPRLPE